MIFFGGLDDYEPILKQEILSYQMCLEAIRTTSEKLSITPENTVDTLDGYLVEYNLSDGILVIICDEKREEIRILAQ